MTAKPSSAAPAQARVDPETPQTPSSDAPDTPPEAEASTSAPDPKAPGDAQDAAGGAKDAKALAIERKRIAERMEELKNDKLRRQLEQMEADATEELEAAKRSAAAKEENAAAPRRMGPPPVPRARARFRHFMAFLAFLLMVVAPIVATTWYLWTRAHDRYVSYAGFSVRTEEIGSSFELLTGVAEISGSSSSDTDILYKFIQSPELVALVDAQLNLREMWGKPGQDWTDPDHDPVFSYNPEGAFRTLVSWGLVEAGQPALEDVSPETGTIEDLTEHWSRMISVFSDSGTGLIDLEVQAFSPVEAQQIAQLIYDESSSMINRLSAIAREDATRYAREERDNANERLTEARQALVRFRLASGIVDPTVTIQEQQGLLVPLQTQLAQALIDLDEARLANSSDPRIPAMERRVGVIEDRIAAERRNQGLGGEVGEDSDQQSFAVQLAEYERLAANLAFAQTAFTSAQGAFDSATAEAQRQNRYLAAHVNPTRAEAATQPQRETLLALVALFSFLIWAITVLAAYALRDRR